MKGHKVTTCRKLPRAQELIKQDKQQYWNKRKGYTKKSANNNNSRHQQINEVDDNASIDEVEIRKKVFMIKTAMRWMTSIFQQAISPKKRIKCITTIIDLEHIEEIVNSSVHPQALYQTYSNGHNLLKWIQEHHIIAFQNHYGIGLR